jgi:DNA-binding NarL/FixJ family response regulator
MFPGNDRKDVDIPMRVIIVDDHPPFLAVVAVMLQQAPDVQVVGRATGGREALAIASTLKPDLVLVDYSMPDMTGAAVAKSLKAGDHPPKVVVMSFQNEPEYRDMAMNAGADAFLPKTELHRELVPLLRRLDEKAA